MYGSTRSTSAKTAAYGSLKLLVSKHGSIGARVQPQALPPLGGEIVAGRDGALHRGTAEEVASLKSCDFVAYESEPAGLGRFGVCLIVLDNSAGADRIGPWFIRDYGMAMFNATQFEDIRVADGDSWRCALRVVAYDRPIAPDRAATWRAVE